MKNMSYIFKEEQTIEFFHKILTDKTLENQEVPSIHPLLNYFPNQYYLCTVIELLIKYQILHKEDNISDFVKQIEDVLTKSKNYKEFLIEANRLIATSIQTKLSLSDQLSKENKKKILEYAYQNYIVDGYYFYSMSSSNIKQITKEGIYPLSTIPLLEEIKQVNRIFEIYKTDNIFGMNPKGLVKDYFEITDSPSLSFFYSIYTPIYFSNFISQAGNFINAKENGYNRKNYDICSNNIEIFCNKLNISDQDKSRVMNYFNQQWDLLDASSLFPAVAFIKRKIVGRDMLDDYEKIVELSEQQDIIYSLSKIMDSRYPSDRRYSKILPKDFMIVTFPSYEMMLQYERKEVIKEEPKVTKQVPTTKTNNHGHADIIALLGLFLITLGCTWLVASFYFKIR